LHIPAEGSLTLGELEAAARRALAVLLAFLDTAVAGDEPGLLQGAAQLDIGLQQRLGDTVLDRPGLP